MGKETYVSSHATVFSRYNGSPLRRALMARQVACVFSALCVFKGMAQPAHVYLMTHVASGTQGTVQCLYTVVASQIIRVVQHYPHMSRISQCSLPTLDVHNNLPLLEGSQPLSKIPWPFIVTLTQGWANTLGEASCVCLCAIPRPSALVLTLVISNHLLHQSHPSSHQTPTLKV